MADGTRVRSTTTAATAATPPSPPWQPILPSLTCTRFTRATIRNPTANVDPAAEATIPARSTARLIRAVEAADRGAAHRQVTACLRHRAMMLEKRKQAKATTWQVTRCSTVRTPVLHLSTRVEYKI